ncbi:Dabb family protein [Flexibacterium corallicola]|uniref:Dabb family protein n=1 Tax=Flexibacterium corallicola TaxID=3037259 RepID=UPI00286F9AD4|nr:Dabb family protein [Pseudovibrio sp. M1P-2-3]
MIRHIVLFNAKNPKDREKVYEGLNLLKQNPFCMHLEVGRNIKTDSISENWVDFVVYGEFENEEQLSAFKAHDIYHKSIEVVRPLRDRRLAADFLS